MLDQIVRSTSHLPWPANRLAFAFTKRLFKAAARHWPEYSLSIEFGRGVAIEVPLGHPAVYWRIRPEDTNRNFIALAEACAGDGRAVVDVGANVGDGAALLRSAGVSAPLILVEGSDRWFELLERNASELPGESTCLKALLGAHSADLHLSLEEENGTGRLLPGRDSVRITTADELLAPFLDSPGIALIKTDTDGFDFEVFAGSELTVGKAFPVWFTELADRMLRDNGGSADEVFELADRYGYEQAMIWDHDGNFIRLQPVGDEVAPLVDQFPGAPGTGFLDVAFFGPNHVAELDSVCQRYSVTRN